MSRFSKDINKTEKRVSSVCPGCGYVRCKCDSAFGSESAQPAAQDGEAAEQAKSPQLTDWFPPDCPPCTGQCNQGRDCPSSKTTPTREMYKSMARGDLARSKKAS